MLHSLVFTMASNIQTEEDEPMHPVGLDMTRGSLHDILDGNEVNVSTALPSVPQCEDGSLLFTIFGTGF